MLLVFNSRNQPVLKIAMRNIFLGVYRNKKNCPVIFKHSSSFPSFKQSLYEKDGGAWNSHVKKNIYISI